MDDENEPRQRAVEGLMLRLFTDDEFVDRLEVDPVATLEEAGITLDEEQQQMLAGSRGELAEREAATPAVLPAVGVVVRVAVSPAVRSAVQAQAEVRVAVAVTSVSEHRESVSAAEDVDAADDHSPEEDSPDE